MININGHFQSVRTGSFIPLLRCLQSGKFHVPFVESQTDPDWKGSSSSFFCGKGSQGDCSNLVQLHLENLQCWRLYYPPGEVIPVSDCSHCKILISYIMLCFCPVSVIFFTRFCLDIIFPVF